ncbi:MAG: TonB-dependent receptor [Gemmatimonadetes bacterium]|nr:TonB-dependent receptor [Gemmatimonadota bacterium]
MLDRSLSWRAPCAAFLLALVAPAATAQRGGGPGEIRGRLVGAGVPKPIGTGTVSVRRGSDTAVVARVPVHADGKFEVTGLAVGRYGIAVRALGFAPLTRLAIAVTAEHPVVELGDLALTEVVVQLEGQKVVAEKEEVALSPDRNTYSAKNMTSTAGGTAVDVLRNVPSVELDANNNVSLRGNTNVVVQINGRPTPLKGDQLAAFLAQLPASMVKHVEVATNPSAKNDPDGSAGLINIVLDQEADIGLSGGFNSSVGTTGAAQLSGNIASQTGPWTWFVSASGSLDERPLESSTDRSNHFTTSPATSFTNGDGANRGRSGGLTLRGEYRLTKKDAITFDGMSFVGMNRNENGLTLANADNSGTPTGLVDESNLGQSHGWSQNYNLALRHLGDPKQTAWSTELRYNDNDNTNASDLANLILLSDPTVSSLIPFEHDLAAGRQTSLSLQGDYTHPFAWGGKLEIGAKGVGRNSAYQFNPAVASGVGMPLLPDTARATASSYHERTASAYAVWSQPLGPLEVQAGLRLEKADNNLEVPATGKQYDVSYSSAFPSAILRWNATPMRQFKLSYARRISRPDAFQLYPSAVRQDARSVFKGNPSLQPEYTDSYEMGWQEALPWGSIQVTPFLRKSIQSVRNIQTIDSAGTLINTFDNLAGTTTYGADVNVNVRAGPLTVNAGGSAYHYASDASNLPGNLSTTAKVWNVRTGITWQVTTKADFQAWTSYRGPQVREGGSNDAFIWMNLSARYKLWGDQGSITLRASDPFGLTYFGYRTNTPLITESGVRYFGVRGVFISVSRSFGRAPQFRPKGRDSGDDTNTERPPTAGPPGAK